MRCGIGMMRCGRSTFRVAIELRVSRTSVLKWWRQWKGSGKCRPTSKKSTGRPRITVACNDRKLVIAAKRQRFESVPRLFVSWVAIAGTTCSVRTAYRRLAEAGLKSYRPVVRIPLTSEHRRRRVDWCRRHANWTDNTWKRVLWSDESRFTIDFHDGRVIRVHRQANEHPTL